MKTLLQKLVQWLRKNWKYCVLALLAIFVVSWIALRESKISKQQRKINTLEAENKIIQIDRDKLSEALKILESKYGKIEASNDSLKRLLAKYQLDLIALKKKHKNEIDSLIQIPIDTVYVRLNEVYPNLDNSPLNYPFSGFQIRGIYNTAVQFPMLEAEYSLQGETLKTCLWLNEGYSEGIANLESQVENLKANIGKCDQQVNNYKSEIVILNKKVKNKTFWSRTLAVITLVTTGIAIMK